MSDRDTRPPATPDAPEVRKGYQGTHDPGRPTGFDAAADQLHSPAAGDQR